MQLKQRSIDYTFHLTCLKYVFSLASLLATFNYWKQIRTYQSEDLGLIQKWIMLLLVLLVCFNEPLSGIRNLFPYKIYYVLQALTQSTFISMILFFWLVIVHSISSVSQHLLVFTIFRMKLLALMQKGSTYPKSY